MKNICFVLLSMCSFTVTFACKYPYQEDVVYEYSLGKHPHITLLNTVGPIAFESSAQEKVVIYTYKYAQTQENLARLKIFFDKKDTALTIKSHNLSHDPIGYKIIAPCASSVFVNVEHSTSVGLNFLAGMFKKFKISIQAGDISLELPEPSNTHMQVETKKGKLCNVPKKLNIGMHRSTWDGDMIDGVLGAKTNSLELYTANGDIIFQ